MLKKKLPKPLLLLTLFINVCNVSVASNENQQELHFVENKGQVTNQSLDTREDIDFALRLGAFNIYIGNGQIHYQWIDGQEIYRMDVTLIGANTNASYFTGEEQGYFENYYNHNYPEGITVKSFNKVTYKNVYPGIDWVLYAKNGSVKYDFIVNAYADPALIKLEYSGATQLSIQDGVFTAETPKGKVTEQKPFSYNPVTGRELDCSYVLNGDVLSFDIEKLESKVIIDPKVQWITYCGGQYGISYPTVTSDSNGNAYVGATASNVLCNIATTGAHQMTVAGSADAAILMFDKAGKKVWGTFFGGVRAERVIGIYADNYGNVYTSGYTFSTAGIATANAYQKNYIGGTNIPDVYLAKFDAKNGLRKWSTYYGDLSYESNAYCSGDIWGNVFLYYATPSGSNAVTTPGADKENPPNGANAVLVKFDSSGNRMWGTFVGGNFIDNPSSVTTDNQGDVIVAGTTHSGTGIATTGAYQIARNGGFDGFLSKYDSSGKRLWSTYYGGEEGDAINGVACDDLNNIYVVGGTKSISGIASANGFRTSPQKQDGFIGKFSPSGNRVWATYFGGEEWDRLEDVVIAANNKLYAVGGTFSLNNIATQYGHDTSYGGASTVDSIVGDAVFVEYDLSGQPIYGTYLGGERDDNGNEIAISKNTGTLYFSGNTASKTGISTQGAYQVNRASIGLANWNDTVDAYLACFDTSVAVSVFEKFIEKNKIVLSPNPVTQNFNIYCNVKDNAFVYIKIINALGVIMLETKARPVQGIVSKDIVLGDGFPSGYYTVILSQGVNIVSSKMLVLKQM